MRPDPGETGQLGAGGAAGAYSTTLARKRERTLATKPG